MSSSVSIRVSGLLLFAVLSLSAESPRPLGHSRIIAPVPFPGYPEGIAVSKGKIYVSGPAAFGVPGNFVPSLIHVYDLQTGSMQQPIQIQNQPAQGLRALSCLTTDKNGDLYVVDEQQGMVKIDRQSGAQTIYAAPFYPVYTSAFNPPAPMLPNDLAFDKNGYLYVTDTFQATIWRVPPGGGTPTVWFQGPQIDGAFGPNGIRFDDKGEKVYFAVTFDAGFQGHIYTLPVVDKPTVADLQIFHTYEPGAGPDGIAFGKSGKLYVALAGSSQISVLTADGSEAARYSNPGWQNPANIAFNDKEGTLLVTNHASLVPNPVFNVFDVYVDDKAGKLQQ